MKQIITKKKNEEMKIVSYQKIFKKDFINLNLVWIKRYFKVEP